MRLAKRLLFQLSANLIPARGLKPPGLCAELGISSLSANLIPARGLKLCYDFHRVIFYVAFPLT